MPNISILSLIPEYCALFILLVLMFINKRKSDSKHTKTNREIQINTDFVKCEVISLFLIIVDIIRYSCHIPVIEYIMAMLFHCSIVMVANSIISYIYDILPSIKSSAIRFYNIRNNLTVFTIFLIILLAPTKLIYGLVDGKVIPGPLFIISYVVGFILFLACMISAYKAQVSKRIIHTMYLIILCTTVPCIFEVIYKKSITSGIGFVTGLLLLSNMFSDIFDMTHGTESFANISTYLRQSKNKDCKVFVFSIKPLNKKFSIETIENNIHKMLLSFKNLFESDTIFESNQRYAFVLKNIDFNEISNIWEKVTYKYIDNFECKAIVVDKKYISNVNLSILSDVELTEDISEFSDIDKDKIERKKLIKSTIQSIVSKDEYMDKRIITMVQPIKDIKKNKFLTGEMLTRIKVDGIDSIIMPYEFIPIVEELKCVHKFNLCILDSACRLMKRLRDENVEFDSISVNFDPSELIMPSFVSDVISIVNRHEISPDCIHIEVTESNEINNLDKTNKCIDELILLGFSVYLDDFGTKYSNIVELLSSKFHVLKLDRQLIIKALDNEMSLKVITALSSACSAAGYKVLFEGVDSDNGVQLAEITGASYIQGFYYSRPLSWDKFIEFIRTNNMQLE